MIANAGICHPPAVIDSAPLLHGHLIPYDSCTS